MNYWYNNRQERGPWTTIVAAVSVGVPELLEPINWSSRDASIIEGLTKLWRQGETTYYGYL